VDEYLTEKEQIEQIKQWWRDYGWYLVGGVVVSALGYLGLNQYNAYRDGIAEQAAALYAEFATAVEEQRDNVDPLLARLHDEYPDSPYAHQASLLAARHYLIRNSARAAEELERVMNNGTDSELALIARLRLARVEAYRENYDQAMAVLDVEAPGMFEARIAEIRGDVHTARGELEQAREAYVQALTSLGSDALDRNFVQMKLNAIRPDVVASPATPTPADPVPADPAAADPTPPDSAPTDSTPTDPAPTDSAAPETQVEGDE
jgi:predicted negative regulator of RcsB-dependent stress response